jgi:signal transduction histidine kinase
VTTLLIPVALLASAGLALCVGTVSWRRPAARGIVPFTWLSGAIAWWCLAGAAHAFAGTLDAKLLWARIQYVGIAAVPPLWLLFCAEHGGATWFRERRRQALLWAVPALTLLGVVTNDWHGAIWPDVRMSADGRVAYGHGWWFWIAASCNYVMVVAGALLTWRSLRRTPPPLRAQYHALLAAALLPLIGNLVYVAGRAPVGLDPTPLAFAISSLLFAWALFRHQLFHLVPVARDMVVDSLSDAVFVLDTARRVLDMNAAARRLSGEAAWLGQPLDRVLPIVRRHAIALTAQSTTIADGGAHYDLRLMPVRLESGELAAGVMLVRDISEQRRAEAERDALAARVQEQQQRESLSVLAGGLAHDFNNLLAGIVGNADLLALQVAPSSEMGNNVGAILLGAQRAADLVDKMLAYAGERHGSTSRVDLDHLVRDLLDLLQASAARHCALHYEGTPAFVDGDATQIRQVAMNLIINAAEAVEEGTGIVRVCVGIDRLSAERLAELDAAADAEPGAYARLEVRDNGHGMSDATMQRIFKPFFTTKPTGHGLGLAAVQGIVRGHRGAMHVESTVGGGARFCCWFPLADVREAANTESAAAPPAVAATRVQA